MPVYRHTARCRYTALPAHIVTAGMPPRRHTAFFCDDSVGEKGNDDRNHRSSTRNTSSGINLGNARHYRHRLLPKNP